MLRSVMEAANLGIFAQVALVLFVAVFVSVIVRERVRSRREVDECARLPLEDGTARD